eukprot:Pompholyxophrys_sp_v1_NODE_2_length_20472_cov_5.132586.p12 type:complete len:243 gc:universal NODE_2_length_20472_cov_5.132586:4756-5484(+)
MSLPKTIQKAIEKNIDKFVAEIESKFGVSKKDLMEIWVDVSKMKIKNKNKKLSPWLQFCKDQRIIIKQNNPTVSFGEISKMIGEKWSTMTKEEKTSYNKKPIITSPIVEEEESVNLLSDEESVIHNDDELVDTDNEQTKIVETYVDEETMVAETHDEETMIAETRVDDEEKTMIAETHNDEMNCVSEKLKGYSETDLKKMKTSQLKDMCKILLLSKTGKKEEVVDRLLKYKNTPGHDDETTY